MAKRIVGLDIGSYSIKCLRLETGKRQERLKLLDMGQEILPVLEDDEQDLRKRQLEAIKKLQSKGLLDGDIFVSSLPAIDTNMRRMEVPFEDSRKIEAILPGLLDSEMPFSLDDVIKSWHVEIEKYQKPGKDGEGKIRVGFAKKTAIKSLLDLLHSLDIDPRILHLSPAVYFELIREFGTEYLLSNQEDGLASFIDFGHSSTNIVIFDQNGIVLTKTMLYGGDKLTKNIAEILNIPYNEAEKIKHEYNNNNKAISELIINYQQEVFDELNRLRVFLKGQNLGELKAVCLVGGGTKLFGLTEFFNQRLEAINCKLKPFREIIHGLPVDEQLALSLSMGISALNIHSRDNRFNFRKDEFAFRGGLDFIRGHAPALMIWGLIIFCAITSLWFSKSFVLEKENKIVQSKIIETCKGIFNQKDINGTKCLTLMQEQINAHTDMGVPDYSASDVYISLAKNIPEELPVVISEMDITEKKLRIKGETDSYENVDNLISLLSNIPCFVKVEKGGRVQKVESGVGFQITNDIDCGKTKADKKT